MTKRKTIYQLEICNLIEISDSIKQESIFDLITPGDSLLMNVRTVRNGSECFGMVRNGRGASEIRFERPFDTRPPLPGAAEAGALR